MPSIDDIASGSVISSASSINPFSTKDVREADNSASPSEDESHTKTENDGKLGLLHEEDTVFTNVEEDFDEDMLQSSDFEDKDVFEDMDDPNDDDGSYF